MALGQENELVGQNLDQFEATYTAPWYGQGGGNGTVRAVKADGISYYQDVQNILGLTTVGPLGVGLTRYLPWRDPLQTEQICTRVDVKGLAYAGQVGGLVTDTAQPMATRSLYENVTLRLTFECPRFPIGTRDPAGVGNAGLAVTYESSRFCSKVVKPGYEWMQVALGALVYVDTPAAQVRFLVPRRVPLEVIETVWWGIPNDAIPKTAIKHCLLKTNSVELNLPAFPPPATYPAGTIYLESFDIQDAWQPDGTRCANIRYIFRRRAINLAEEAASGSGSGSGSGCTFVETGGVGGWNHIPTEHGDFREVMFASGRPLFLSADLNCLFKPETQATVIP